jgi:hypothetical protein
MLTRTILIISGDSRTSSCHVSVTVVSFKLTELNLSLRLARVHAIHVVSSSNFKLVFIQDFWITVTSILRVTSRTQALLVFYLVVDIISIPVDPASGKLTLSSEIFPGLIILENPIHHFEKNILEGTIWNP